MITEEDIEFLDKYAADAVYVYRQMSNAANTLGAIALPCPMYNLLHGMDFLMNALESAWKQAKQEAI